MLIPTEPIGSIPCPAWLINAITARGGTDPCLQRFEATGSPMISDGARVLGTRLAEERIGGS